jgi:NAD(P)-dependent dehydrogenase (short-subunit alcohol dehydrogenase family)
MSLYKTSLSSNFRKVTFELVIMKTLENKVALITGAAQGIGKSMALLFAENGAKLVITDLNAEAGENVVNAIENNGGEAIFVKADTSNPEDSRKSVDAALARFGKLDIAVNNAGIVGPVQSIEEYDLNAWNKVLSINLSGVFYGMKYQIPAMLKNGSGSIINMSSIVGSAGAANFSAYVSSKHGVIGLTRTGALEYSSRGIRINAVGPGYTDTSMIDFLDSEQKDIVGASHPIGRLARVEEIAEFVLWLASDKASFATGTYYPIDGGYLAQ